MKNRIDRLIAAGRDSKMTNEFGDVNEQEYKEKTGIDYSLLITNVSPEHLYIYENVVPLFPEIEILNKAYNVFCELLPDRKAIVFKEKYDIQLLQKFWKACDEVRSANKK
jgi:hypothetical protein